ncbi:DUF2125 domain-containing protein [Sulfitobacter sp. HNIBRBA2951]|uniref:DUF2125 domain-containing protein n=1 Tax=Sulfitobacter aquimarinus TaxID=3158557 RepID=UPI0032DF7219
MSHFNASLFSSVLAVSLSGTTAFADLAPRDVWGDWRAYLEGMGYAVTATEATNGDTLNISDITVQIAGGPDVETMILRLPPLQFAELSGGRVEVVMSETMPLEVEITPKSTKRLAKAQLTYTQSGHSMIASGDPDAIVFDYTADAFNLSLGSLSVDGTVFDPATTRFSLGGTALQSQTQVTAGEVRSYDQNMQMGQVTYDIFFKDPAQVETMMMKSTLEEVVFAGTSVLPVQEIAQAQNLAPLIAAGFAFDGTFSTKATETQTEITSDEGASKFKTGSQNTQLAVAMGADGVSYDVTTQQVQVGAQLAGIPFPLFVEMASAGMKIKAPVMKSDAPQDIAVGFDLTDFTMSDIIWALFDPSAQLPRDPATIALDLTGKAKVLLDVFDLQQAADAKVPAELNALSIDRLVVDAVGAKLEAQGAATFDNTDKTTLPGFPKPVGDITVNLAGANGLMDKLVAMGLLPAQQVTGARMMMGLFAVPGDAPDTLTSKIEFNEAGQILANGQRVK